MRQVWVKILIALALCGLLFIIFIGTQKAQPIIPRDNINALAKDVIQFIITNDTSSLRSITTKESQWIWDDRFQSISYDEVTNIFFNIKRIEKGQRFTNSNGKEITKEEWNKLYDSMVTKYLTDHRSDKFINQLRNDMNSNIHSESLFQKIDELSNKAHEETEKILPSPITLYEDKYEIYITTSQDISYKLTASTVDGKYLLDGFEVIDSNGEER